VIEVVAPGTEGAKARDTGELLDVWYECEHCRAKIEEHHKTWMLERGRWIAEHPEMQPRRLPPAVVLLAARLVQLAARWCRTGSRRTRTRPGTCSRSGPTRSPRRPTSTRRAGVRPLAQGARRELQARHRADGRPAADGVGRRAGQPPGSEGQGLGPRRGVVARRLRGDLRRHRDHAAVGALDEYLQKKFRTRAARRCASSPPRSTRAIARRPCTTGAARGAPPHLPGARPVAGRQDHPRPADQAGRRPPRREDPERASTCGRSAPTRRSRRSTRA
jgi:hypothetical protein